MRHKSVAQSGFCMWVIMWPLITSNFRTKRPTPGPSLLSPQSLGQLTFCHGYILNRHLHIKASKIVASIIIPSQIYFYTCNILIKIACNWIVASRMKEKLIKTGALKASLYERNTVVQLGCTEI